ncbi:MAG: TetR/AcrR family transcriptional regulator [Actinomycetales bacterium]|nr:TetR/AcrR family transcriptional regulator [Candidatus Lutibacillus vidarii]
MPQHDESRTDQDLLAAVREEVLAYGVRRATATSIAARAGVSRMTVYRRGGGVKQLVLDALSREFETQIAEVVSGARGETVRDRLTDAVVGGVSALASSPLVTALLRHDPELLVPYLVDRLGHSQAAFVGVVTPLLQAGIGEGSVRDADAEALAMVLLHAVQGFVVSSGIIRLDLSQDEVDDELRHLIDGYLRPAQS